MRRGRLREGHSGSLRAPVVVLALALCAPGQDAIAGAGTNPDIGRDIAAACASCHYGNAARGAAIPGLAGVEPATIEQRVREFRDGRRPSTVMRQIANGYSDAQIAAAAAYLSTQKP